MSLTKANNPAGDNCTKKRWVWLGRNRESLCSRCGMKGAPALQNGATPEQDEFVPTYAPPLYLDMASTPASASEAAILSIAHAIKGFALASNAPNSKALFYKRVPKATQAAKAARAATATADAITGVVRCIYTLPRMMEGIPEVVAMWIRLILCYNTRVVTGLAAGLDPLIITSICAVEYDTRLLQEKRKLGEKVRSEIPKNIEQWMFSRIGSVFFTVPFSAIVDILPTLNDAITKVAMDLVATCKDVLVPVVKKYIDFADASAKTFANTSDKLQKRR